MTQIRIHNIATIKTPTKEDFRSINYTKQEEEIKKILHKHWGEAKAGAVKIYRPRTGGKQFEPLALITFKTPTLKYAFERTFATWKRSNPSDKLSISRAPPAKSPGDKDQPTP